ncbi:hypothetical protein BD410DRAFT_782443 [Rickenella mellea]|uniref:EF-hand domain-containing protein n=1 Tax=Rickenella mellea TaxID=50990 RepID=A0A4Y7QJD3_9AGAM|nr:hypothetical protein BD410DRAFT_782443 [Rickenella mellea]
MLDLDSSEPSRVQSPRPETPEPGSRQGRRNAEADVQLLDHEGSISDKFERCLQHIFAKYCTPQPANAAGPTITTPTGVQPAVLLRPPPGAYLTPAALDRWAVDTNGAPFSAEAKDELKEFLDVNEGGDLTFNGFLQIYQLQTENDEEETWRDLSSHGFDRSLTLVATRREDMDMDSEEGTRLMSGERLGNPLRPMVHGTSA